MPVERWGSLAVDDHVDTKALATNVLLYDRLVVPVMTDQPDRDERSYWIEKGWDPDLQAQRLDQLEDLAVPRPWNAYRREVFRSRIEALRAEQYDANHIDAKGMTRMILAQESPVDLPPGVRGVTVVAAYNSLSALTEDFRVADVREHVAAQACLVTRRLAIPDLPGDVLLRECISLSRDEEFRERRSDLFEWQELAVARRWTPPETVDRLCEMTDRYNAKVKEASKTLRWKLAFTVGGCAVGFLGGLTVAAAASAALSLIQFMKHDSEPAIEAGSSQPAAMFHDMEVKLGARLR